MAGSYAYEPHIWERSEEFPSSSRCNVCGHDVSSVAHQEGLADAVRKLVDISGVVKDTKDGTTSD